MQSELCMSDTAGISSTADGLTLTAYAGDGATLLAFDVTDEMQDDLAGFALEYVDPTGKTEAVLNRLSFADPITKGTTPEQRRFIPTTEAPLQKFHWVHFPADVLPGTFTYRATAMRFKQGTEDQLEAGASTEASVVLMPLQPDRFQLGFTRGYISSQAYVDQFHNAPIAPSPHPFDFDTAAYEQQYHWLGFHARRLVFDFLAEAVADQSTSLDVFAYDLDEPDVIRQLGVLGSRLRLYLDNSASHVSGTAREPHAHAWLEQQGAQIQVGHFNRFSHDKVMVLKRGDQAVKVLSGSANFSVRGLYVQSNNVFVFDDPPTADLYSQAFEQTWSDARGFKHSEIAAQWYDAGGSDGIPNFSVCFSPHADSAVSLDRVTQAVVEAKSSVLFAIMEIGSGSGPLLDAIKALPDRPELYAFGTTQRLDGDLQVTKSGVAGSPFESPFIPFSYLSEKVPEPFKKEWNGGAGQVIHHKFVVTDFNGATPLAFAGSSNLAAGGEEANGDNLVVFNDRGVVTKYAIEAIKLVDHYRFRAAMKDATDVQPLKLKTRSEDWTADYFDQANAKFRERQLFSAAPDTQ
jgi:hypothetical protein